MIIDSHLHLNQKKCFDLETNEKLGLKIPEDTPLDVLVQWLKDAGVSKAVVMGQDMTRIWKTTFGEEYLRESYLKYPDFLIPLASIEPLDEYNRFNEKKFLYFKKTINEYGFRGVLLTPPYGHYCSNDKTVYPFYEFAQEKRVVIQYHHSAQSGPAILAPTQYASLYLLNDVIIDFPQLKIVIEHIGYPWSEHLFVLMANDKNLWTDLAMTYSRPVWLTWNLVLAKEYGVIDRVMYASDYVVFGDGLFSDHPQKDFQKWISFLRTGLNEICEKSGWPLFSSDEINGFLGNNAAKLYNL
ncbi:MAG: amidohydrolase family protein [Candidatus Atribacteria bacterium]|nr:amidohydrolase family protein [Candidatus Atribacteria bacterium]